MAKKVGLILILVVILGRSSPLAETYHWPLGVRRGISATFGEYREGHLHAGVDLKTWGREGYPVYAVARGYVWRLKTSPWGYGKAIYLKLWDGRYAVYAHLSDFVSGIRRVVEEEQEKQIRYSVDIFLPPEQIPVEKGELIGYSGSTGKGPPHLHFELRDGKHRPINPLISGLQVKDNRFPVFKSICLEPFIYSSSVDGFPKSKIYRFMPERGIYRLSGVPQIWGKIGCAVDIYDLLDGSENLCAVYGLEFFLDGKLIFAKRYECFSYPISHQVYLDWDLPLLLRGKGHFSRLYLLPGNSLPLYSPMGFCGFIEGLEPGYHLVKILATDAAGNMSQALFKVLVDLPPVVTKFECSPQGEVIVEGRDGDGVVKEEVVESLLGDVWKVVGRGRSELKLPLLPEGLSPLRAKVIDNWGITSPYYYLWSGGEEKEEGKLQFKVDLDPHQGYILLWVRSSDNLWDDPQLYLYGQGGISLIPAGPLDYLVSLPLVNSWWGKVGMKVVGEGLNRQKVELDTAIWAWFIPAPGGKKIDAPGLRIDFPTQSIYQDMIVAVEEVKVDTPPSLSCLKGPFKIEPVDIPFDKKVEISIDIPSGADTLRAGLYSLKGDDWKWVKGSRREGGRVISKVRHFSTYAVLLDTIRPRIWDINPPSYGRLRKRKPLLWARVNDQNSGIDSDEDVRIWLDGERVIAEWDPEMKSLKYRPGKPLPPGHHRLKIWVRDRVGNQTTRQSEFWILR